MNTEHPRYTEHESYDIIYIKSTTELMVEHLYVWKISYIDLLGKRNYTIKNVLGVDGKKHLLFK